MKVKISKIITILLLLFSLLGLFTYSSYVYSKRTAVNLIGDTVQYFPLAQARITVEPYERNRIVWLYKFSFPNSFDEDLYVYTNLWGTIAVTIPRNLENILRASEKLELHPYSKEFIEQSRNQKSNK